MHLYDEKITSILHLSPFHDKIKLFTIKSRIRRRVDTFLKRAPRTAQVASGQVVQTPSYNGPPRTNDMLKPKKLLEENMSLEAALHWFKTYKNHLDLNKAMLAQQSIGVRRGILENDIDPHMANALGAHSNVKDDTSIDDCLNILKEIFMEKNPIWVRPRNTQIWNTHS